MNYVILSHMTIGTYKIINLHIIKIISNIQYRQKNFYNA